MKIGLGLITCDRADYFRQSFAGVASLPVDELVIINDGEAQLPAACDPATVAIYATPLPHSGVGIAKNMALGWMMDEDCDWLFLAEDDIIATDPRAITGYIEACEKSGWESLAFGPHGPHNQTAVRTEGACDIYPNIVGAWVCYSRHAIETVGLMDPVLATLNSMEHVELDTRLMLAGLTHRWPGRADAAGSKAWLHEIPGSIENTSIPHAGRRENLRKAMARFREVNPEGFHLLWGDTMPGWAR